MTTSNQDLFEELKYNIRVSKYGSKFYYNKDGKLHREDGPAAEYFSGTDLWYRNGLKHRLDGPAVEYADGVKYWYINDELYSEEEFNDYIKSRNLR